MKSSIKIISMDLHRLQPSQLYINAQKLQAVQENLAGKNDHNPDPLPVLEMDGNLVLTDGHTRALAAGLSGITKIQVYHDEDDIDLELYRICVDWCLNAGIHSVFDLKNRIIKPEDYQQLWLDRCKKMHQSRKRGMHVKC